MLPALVRWIGHGGGSESKRVARATKRRERLWSASSTASATPRVVMSGSNQRAITFVPPSARFIVTVTQLATSGHSASPRRLVTHSATGQTVIIAPQQSPKSPYSSSTACIRIIEQNVSNTKVPKAKCPQWLNACSALCIVNKAHTLLFDGDSIATESQRPARMGIPKFSVLASLVTRAVYGGTETPRSPQPYGSVTV